MRGINSLFLFKALISRLKIAVGEGEVADIVLEPGVQLVCVFAESLPPLRVQRLGHDVFDCEIFIFIIWAAMGEAFLHKGKEELFLLPVVTVEVHILQLLFHFGVVWEPEAFILRSEEGKHCLLFVTCAEEKVHFARQLWKSPFLVLGEIAKAPAQKIDPERPQDFQKVEIRDFPFPAAGKQEEQERLGGVCLYGVQV